MNILLDSGSDWFWIVDESCWFCSGKARYDSGDSSSSKMVREDSVHLRYGSGECRGDRIQEKVCLKTRATCEGHFCEPVCVESMNIASITSQDAGLRGLTSDGLLGLSPVLIDDRGQDLFIDAAYKQGAIDEKVFSLSFAGENGDSFFTMGGYDINEFAIEDDVTWHDNIGEYFWAVNADGL